MERSAAVFLGRLWLPDPHWDPGVEPLSNSKDFDQWASLIDVDPSAVTRAVGPPPHRVVLVLHWSTWWCFCSTILVGAVQFRLSIETGVCFRRPFGYVCFWRDYESVVWPRKLRYSKHAVPKTSLGTGKMLRLSFRYGKNAVPIRRACGI